MKIRLVYFVLCLSFLANAATAHAEKPWIEVRSPHFRVLTNGSPGDARHVAHEFEQMRYVFATQFPNFRLDSGAPLTIFAARDEQTAKILEPAIWKRKGAKPAGWFHHGWEKQYVMVRLDDTGLDARAVVYHEYTHTILHMNAHWLPTWLDEGMAEFYAYTRFEQHKISIGAPTERFRVLGRTPIPIETLLMVNQRSPYYHDEDKVDLFYAESWALVHYMIFGPGMDRGAKLNQFFQLIQQGTSQKQAFVQVFGSFAAMDTALGQYMRSMAFHAAVVQDPPQIDGKTFTTQTLTMPETYAELAAFHLWNHDLVNARPLVTKALEGYPKLGLAYEVNGFLLFADGNDSAAAAAFSQAYALDGKLYLSLFAKTMLSSLATSDAAADETGFSEAMMKVADLNPQFAPAYVELARLAVRQNNLSSAFALSRKAEELEPSRAGYHLLTGEILLRMGKGAEAAGFAKYVADHWFGPDHDEAVELWNSVPVAQRPAGVTLVDETPKDTQTADGVVKSTTCYSPGQPWSLTLNRDGKNLTFHAKGLFAFGFSDTAWWGEDHFSNCRHLDGMRAIVRYRPTTDAGSEGDVVEIEVRNAFLVLSGAKSVTQIASKP